MPAIRAAAAGPRALGGDGQKTRVLARDLFDAAARHRTELIHTPFYGGRCVTLQTSAPTRSIHANCGRAVTLESPYETSGTTQPHPTHVAPRARAGTAPHDDRGADAPAGAGRPAPRCPRSAGPRPKDQSRNHGGS